jgi:hypothetical protein
VKLDWYKRIDFTPWQAFGSTMSQGFGRKAVAHAVAGHSDRDGRNAFPGVKMLMKETGIGSEHTVVSHLAALVKLGWLVRTERGKRGTAGHHFADVYALAIPSRTDCSPECNQLVVTETGEPIAVRSRTDCSPGRTDCTLGCNTTGPLHQVPSHHSESDDSGAPASGDASPFDDSDHDPDGYQQVCDALGVDAFDGIVHSTVVGMLASGMHPRAVANTVAARMRDGSLE